VGVRLFNVDCHQGDVAFDHVGDCAYYNNKVYLPGTDWNGAVRTVGRIYEFNSADLTNSNKYDINAADIPNDSDLSGMAWDPYNSCFWILGGDHRRIYKYNAAFAYQSRYLDLPHSSIDWYDGICFHPTDGRLYATSNAYIMEFAPIPTGLTATAHDLLLLRATPTAQAGHAGANYYEGIFIDPDEEHMWIGKCHTAGDDPLGYFDYYP